MMIFPSLKTSSIATMVTYQMLTCMSPASHANHFLRLVGAADLMIHEATLGSGLEDEALTKKHTTTKEALELIDKVKPWRSILTHFSCWYMKVAEVLPGHTEKKVLIAYDHMRVRLSDLEWAYKYADLFGQLISNHKDWPEKVKLLFGTKEEE